MAQLRPFKGIRYNQEISGDLTTNVCPPFDSIPKSLQEKLYEISDYNTVRLELGIRGMYEDPYISAAEIQNSWIKNGVLSQDDTPSIYVTEEEFKFGDQIITRKGFICAIKVEKYENKIVIPHEKTREEWVEDRQKLMEVAKSNYSPLLCLYEDDSRETIANLVKSISGKTPYIDIEPDYLQKIKVWRVTDKGTIALITENFNNSKIYIADGHHRYEAGLRYLSKIKKYRSIEENESINYRMIQLISMNEPGLITRSYHRYIKLDKSNSKYIDQIISDENISVMRNNFSLDDSNSIQSFYESILENKNNDVIKFGIIIKDESNITSYTYSNNNTSKNNDYSFLHDDFLQEKFDNNFEENISFETDLDEINNQLLTNNKIIVFIMRPIPMNDFVKTVQSGEVLPPKVTNFLPKPPAGLVFQSIEGEL
ncbi:MAG: DUF1015 domain-containing protein [Chloroflexota bacterium]|nr:DUF1015 domain-containing protein [Chloroflexota bacterium]